MDTDKEITQLLDRMLVAISRRDWQEANAISAQIDELRRRAIIKSESLVRELWPGARVRE